MNDYHKIAVVGGREFSHLQLVVDVVRQFPKNTWLISGGARGVDRVAAETARIWLNYEPHVIPPDPAIIQTKDFPTAAKLRNMEIVELADEVVAFWDGFSSGTAHSIAQAVLQNRPITIYTDWGDKFIDPRSVLIRP